MDTRKRLKRQSNRKARIIDAASRLVVERGMEDVSLTAIARAAGISKGTLYYYYATKESLCSISPKSTCGILPTSFSN
jgi:AcrR family transcriptional regulator